MKYKSEFFDNVTELVDEKDRLVRTSTKKLERQKAVRAFINGLPTMTEEEALKKNRSEIVNYLMSFRSMNMRIARYLSTVFLTDRFVEVNVHTGDVEQDFALSEAVTSTINAGLINQNMRFIRFAQKLAGELQITGAVPLTFTEKGDWLPKINFAMLFPPETGLDPNSAPYAFTPKDMTFAELKKLRNSVSEDSSVFDKAILDNLIDFLRKQISDEAGSSIDPVADDLLTMTGSSLETNSREKKHTVRVWTYNEVKTTDDESYVSSTYFIEGIPGTNDSAAMDAGIFAHVEKAFSSPEEWLYHFAVDSEVGGDTTLESLRGVAEIIFPSASQREELLNLMVEGDKLRAKPRFKPNTNADIDKILSWNPEADVLVPDGVEPFDMRNSTSQLQTPLAMLTQNEANITSGDVANPATRGGELRQQAVERQSNNGLLTNHELNIWYIHIGAIIERAVERVFTLDVKPGSAGYNEIMWVREQLTRQGVPFEELGKKTFGKFDTITVTINRVFGDGDMVSMDETATWLMENLMRFSPVIRPAILRLATSIKTRDPRLAASLVQIPDYKINHQRIVAENEADTIMRRAMLGEVLPISPEDVHINHFETHFKDMTALLANHQIEPWGKKQVLEFAGLMEHSQQHLQAIMEDPASVAEGNALLSEFSQLVQAAQAIASDAQAQDANQQPQLTPKEQADIQVKMRDLMRKEQELGIKIESERALQQSRAERAALVKRKSLVSEIMADRNYKLQQAKLALEAQRNASQQPAPTQNTV